MFTGESSWSLGVLVGLPIVIILCLVALAAIVFGLAVLGRDDDGHLLALMGVGLLVVTLGVAALPKIGFYPYSAEYHQWREVSGKVTDIEKRLVKSGDGMQEKYVVTYESGNEFGCLDTRCATVEPGDTLTLTCKRAWQYTGVDGYDCNFVTKEEQR